MLLFVVILTTVGAGYVVVGLLMGNNTSTGSGVGLDDVVFGVLLGLATAAAWLTARTWIDAAWGLALALGLTIVGAESSVVLLNSWGGSALGWGVSTVLAVRLVHLFALGRSEDVAP